MPTQIVPNGNVVANGTVCDIHWSALLKWASGIVTTLLTLSVIGLFGLYVQVQVLTSRLEAHLNERYVTIAQFDAVIAHLHSDVDRCCGEHQSQDQN